MLCSEVTMGSECFEACINEEHMHRLAESASSLSQASFTLKRVRNDTDSNHDHTPGNCPAQQNQTDANCSNDDEKKFVRALRRRPWINYGKFDMSSDDESDCEQSFQVKILFCIYPFHFSRLLMPIASVLE
jgi:hypothetical protein